MQQMTLHYLRYYPKFRLNILSITLDSSEIPTINYFLLIENAQKDLLLAQIFLKT